MKKIVFQKYVGILCRAKKKALFCQKNGFRIFLGINYMMTNDTPKSISQNLTKKTRPVHSDILNKNIGNETSNTNDTIKVSPSQNKNLKCEICKYTAKTLSNLKKHYKTQKHLNKTKVNTAKEWTCECGKSYTRRQNYYRHNKICAMKNKTETESEEIKDILKYVIEENKELRNMVTKQQEQISDMLPRIGDTNNFNLQIFLNERCKNAINITDFVNSLNIDMNDLEHTKKHGLSDGITNIVMNKLNELGIYRRPIHCTDVKRETLYIKDNNNWKKDDEEHNSLRDTFNNIIKKQSTVIKEWEELHPEWNKTEQGKEEWIDLVKTIMNDTDENDENKIIKIIAKEVKIN